MKALVYFTFMISCSGAIAQEVVGAAGTNSSNATHSLEWTIGETIITTASNGTNTVTQGFHQTQLEVTNIEDVIVEYDVHVYPNPTNEMLQVDIIDLKENLTMQLYDAAGKLISQTRFNKTQSSDVVDFSLLERGAYYLRLIGEKTNQTISVVKQ